MIIIKEITSYRDGGTISIKVNTGAPQIPPRPDEYCIDRRIGSTTKGKLFAGYPAKGTEIVDKEFIQALSQTVQEHQRVENHLCSEIIKALFLI